MNGWTIAFFTYLLTIIIAFFCAGMIHLMVIILGKYSKKKVNANKMIGILIDETPLCLYFTKEFHLFFIPARRKAQISLIL